MILSDPLILHMKKTQPAEEAYPELHGAQSGTNPRRLPILCAF